MRRLLCLAALAVACDLSDAGNLSIIGGVWDAGDSSIAITPYEYQATWAGKQDAGTWDADAGTLTLWSGCGAQETRVYAYRVINETTMELNGITYRRNPVPAGIHYLRPPPFTPGRCETH